MNDDYIVTVYTILDDVLDMMNYQDDPRYTHTNQTIQRCVDILSLNFVLVSDRYNLHIPEKDSWLR